jgi:hypothetical protein
MDAPTWIDNKKLMLALWPAWKPSPEEGSLLNRKWGQLHQDKLRDCIEQHRLERDAKPDLSAIHKAYCKITSSNTASAEGVREADRTRREHLAVQPPAPHELEEWDRDAERILATATPREIANAKERLNLNVKQPRLLALMVEWCRQNPN